MTRANYAINIQSTGRYEWAAGILDQATKPPQTVTLVCKSLEELCTKLIVTLCIRETKRLTQPGNNAPHIVVATTMPTLPPDPRNQ